MQTTFTIVALAALARSAIADSAATSYDGQFEITVIDPPLAKRDSTCGQDGYLTLSLADGILTDAKGRTGYIASNFQFQFDAPPQENAISTSGFGVYSNGSLALSDSATFYKCLSGDFYNLYSSNWAPQCAEILINILPCGGANAVGQKSDGQPTGTSVGPAPVTQITDGQIQATTGVPVSEYTDGQPQVVTSMPAPIASSTGVPVTQISDGQPQASASTGVPAPTSAAASTEAPAPTSVAASTEAPAPTSAPASTIIIVSTSAGVAAPSTQPGGIYSNTTSTLATVASTGVSASSAPTSTPTPVAGNSASGLSVASTFAATVFGLAAIFLL